MIIPLEIKVSPHVASRICRGSISSLRRSVSKILDGTIVEPVELEGEFETLMVTCWDFELKKIQQIARKKHCAVEDLIRGSLARRIASDKYR